MDERVGVLLVVDDEPAIPRMIIRRFRNYFDEIYYASTPEQAECILHKNHVTHVVCDLDLGAQYRKGMEHIRRWRHTFPEIRRTAIFTGTDTWHIPVYEDTGIFSKMNPADELLRYLIQ